MLGKGLESLIPQKNGQNGDGSANPGANGTSGSSRPQTSWKPDQPGRQNLPAGDPPPLELPILSEEFELPPGNEIVEEKPQKPAYADPSPKNFSIKPPSFAIDTDVTTPVRQGGIAAAAKKDEPLISASIFQIEVDKIVPNPSQPRRVFDEAALQDMAHSIREFGILQPLVVTKVKKETQNGMDVEYQLIAGERRLMASKIAGLKTVPAIIRNVDLEREKLELAILENIQRENLNPIESARAFERLRDEFKLTQREIAAKLGKSREVVANAVRLLDLPVYAQEALQKGLLTESNARFLLAIDDPVAQRKLFDDVVQNHLTSRDVRERIRQYTKRPGRPPGSGNVIFSPEIKAIQEELSAELGTPVEIEKRANNNDGKITIMFYSEEELEGILRKLGKSNQ